MVWEDQWNLLPQQNEGCLVLATRSWHRPSLISREYLNFCQIEAWNLRSGKDVNQDAHLQTKTQSPGQAAESKGGHHRGCVWICPLPLSPAAEVRGPPFYLIPCRPSTLLFCHLHAPLSQTPGKTQLIPSQGFWFLSLPGLQVLCGIKWQP